MSRALARECEFATRLPDGDPSDLKRVALAYELESSRWRLVNRITDEVQTGKKPSPMLAALARLEFPCVITTNYDGLFECALRDVGKDPRVSIYKPTAREPTTTFEDPRPDSPVIYKLHGDLSNRDSIVVTDEDYIQFVLRMRDKDPYDPVPVSLKQLLKHWTTLFIGYSLLDYNLRLLFRTLRWGVDLSNVPEMYSVDRAPDPLILDMWQGHRRFVKFIATDTWLFVPALYERVHGEGLTQ